MIENSLAFIPAVAALLYATLFGIVVTSHPLTAERRYFSVYLASMVVWSLCAFLMLVDIQPIILWFRIMVSAALVSLLGLFTFVQAIFHRRRWWTPVVVWYAILAILFSVFTDWVVKEASLFEGHLIYQFNPLVVLVAGPGYVLIFYSLYDLIRGFYVVRDTRQRERLRYIILALIVLIGGSLVNWTPLGRYPIDIAANGVSALLIAYAILRFQLLEIRLVIRKGILYTFATATTGVIYYVVISLALAWFSRYTGGGLFIASGVIAFATAVLFAPFYTRLQTWVDQIFYRDRYDATQMLQRISGATASLLNLNAISELMLDDLVNTMHLSRAVLFVRHPHDGFFDLTAFRGPALRQDMRFRPDHPLVGMLARESAVISRDMIEIEPRFRSLWGQERLDLAEIDASIFIPMITQRELVGFLALGEKLSGRPYTNDDRTALMTLANQVAVAVQNARLYDELQQSYIQTVVSLANAIDVRDTYTSGHSQDIALLARETARRLGLGEEEANDIYWGGLLHDIGKIGIPDAILLKPGPLTEAEMAVIRRHTIQGAKIIEPIRKLARVAPIVRYSHERYDGKGYPEGLFGEEIPLGARIVAVVDAYSAMIDERVYRKALSQQEAIAELKRNAGTQFDPRVVEVFLQVLRERDESEEPPQ